MATEPRVVHLSERRIRVNQVPPGQSPEAAITLHPHEQIVGLRVLELGGSRGRKTRDFLLILWIANSDPAGAKRDG